MINVIEYYQKLPLYERNSNFIYLYIMIMSRKFFLIEFCWKDKILDVFTFVPNIIFLSAKSILYWCAGDPYLILWLGLKQELQMSLIELL